jgi:hypothetical protein
MGDPSGPYIGNMSTTLGAFLNAAKNFALRLDAPGGQYLLVDLTVPAGTPPCASTNTCRNVGPMRLGVVRTFNTLPDSLVNPEDATGAWLPNGLLDITVGATMNARGKVNFPDPFGRPILWTVRYDPRQYPGASYLLVHRTAADQWTIETGAAGVAMLESANTQGADRRLNEGLFSVPFSMTVTQP